MKVTVDFDNCRSTGLCGQISPDVFELRDDGYLYVLIEEPPSEFHDAVKLAAESCPTEAISLEL
jgi:ferredoxin